MIIPIRILVIGAQGCDSGGHRIGVDGSHDAFIQEDMQFALDLGVQSTPTFFVNGLAIVGAQPLTNFQQIIDKELAGEIP